MQKNATTTLHLGDQAALNRRAERFQREHEIERQKSLRVNGSQSALKTNSQGAHLLNRIWRADSPSTFGPNPDDPEADPVRLMPSFLVTDRRFLECTQLGPPYHRWDKPGAVQRLPPTHIGKGRASHLEDTDGCSSRNPDQK